MKRKITKIEEKLFENGYKLVSKSYVGKSSETTNYYEYHKQHLSITSVVRLDKKRIKVNHYGLLIDHNGLVNGTLIKIVDAYYLGLSEFVEELKDLEPKPIPKELLESVE